MHPASDAVMNSCDSSTRQFFHKAVCAGNVFRTLPVAGRDGQDESIHVGRLRRMPNDALADYIDRQRANRPGIAL